MISKKLQKFGLAGAIGLASASCSPEEVLSEDVGTRLALRKGEEVSQLLRTSFVVQRAIFTIDNDSCKLIRYRTQFVFRGAVEIEGSVTDARQEFARRVLANSQNSLSDKCR